MRKCHLNFYLKDFHRRVASANASALTFKDHFVSSPIIYPTPGHHHRLIHGLKLTLVAPSESIVPCLARHAHSLYLIHEQTRFKCYFIPSVSLQIEPDDEQSRDDSAARFVSSDGSIRFDREKVDKDLWPFVEYSSEENCSYLSSNAVRQWFHTLILVNQTCAIAKRFLTGDGSHITCLVKDAIETNVQFTFATLRLPVCTYSTPAPFARSSDDKSDPIHDAFSPSFLSDRPSTSSNNSILLDYEHYSFALRLRRWPQHLIEQFYTPASRSRQRQWPTKSQLQQLFTKPLLLVPAVDADRWEIQFDLVEQTLFEWCDDSTRFFYALCQQIFARTWTTRRLIKHAFLNYCEKHGLPFSK